MIIRDFFTTFFLSLFLVCFASNRLEGISVYTDSPEFDTTGYSNSDMLTNGEQLVMQLVKTNAIVFDVGANVGNWSLNVLKHNKKIQLHCFEPIPSIFQKLKKNLKRVPAKFSQLALSDTKGKCLFCYYPNHSSLSTIHRRDSEIEEWLNLEPQYIEVKTDSLDNYCKQQGISTIDLLKIDTEGHEYSVILGAEGMLTHHSIHMVQFEYGGCYLDAQITLEEVYTFLKKYNYTIYRIIPDGLVKITNWRPELENFQYCNYLAIYEE